MKPHQHPVYRSSMKFMTSRGLRVLRRHLRKADKWLIAQAKHRGAWLSVEARMQVMLASELRAQAKRREIYASVRPFVVTQTVSLNDGT